MSTNCAPWPTSSASRAGFVLGVVVRDDGSVGAVQVVEMPLEAEPLLGTAISVVRRWRFLPGIRDGRSVHCWIKVELELGADGR